jgi:hypothetical protein
MASIWSRNKLWGGTFTTDVDVADDTNNASVVPASSYLGLKISTEVDSESRNRSKWFTSVIGQLLRAVLHKEEDRATSANLGVSGAEPTTTKYVTVEQLPSVDKTTNDFTGAAGSGALIDNQNTIDVTPVLTGTGKSFVGKLHADFVAWLLARTWLQADLETLIEDIAEPLITAAIAAIPERVAPLTSLTTDDSNKSYSTTTYVDLTGITYTTPNDGITRKYLITFKGDTYLPAYASETNSIEIKLYNTSPATYDYSNILSGLAGATYTNTKTTAVLQTFQEILPNQTIRVAARRGDASSITTNPTIKDCSMIITEIK